MTSPHVAVRDAGSRSRDLFLWAAAIAAGGLLLAAIVRLVPIPAVHAAGLMFIPLLVPVLALVALASIVFGVIALVRTRKDEGRRLATLLVPPLGSLLLLVALPGLVLLAQVLVTAIGGWLA